MKKLLISLGVIFLLFVIGFLLLLSKASPDHAPSEVITVDIETPRGN